MRWPAWSTTWKRCASAARAARKSSTSPAPAWKRCATGRCPALCRRRRAWYRTAPPTRLCSPSQMPRLPTASPQRRARWSRRRWRPPGIWHRSRMRRSPPACRRRCRARRRRRRSGRCTKTPPSWRTPRLPSASMPPPTRPPRRSALRATKLRSSSCRRRSVSIPSPRNRKKGRPSPSRCRSRPTPWRWKAMRSGPCTPPPRPRPTKRHRPTTVSTRWPPNTPNATPMPDTTTRPWASSMPRPPRPPTPPTTMCW